MFGRDLDFDLHNAIQDLIGAGLLEENGSAHGVARIVIHDGYDSLSPTHRILYDAVVTPALRKRAEEIEGKRFGVAAASQLPRRSQGHPDHRSVRAAGVTWMEGGVGGPDGECRQSATGEGQ